MIGSCDLCEFLEVGRDGLGEMGLCEPGGVGPAVMIFRPCVEIGSDRTDVEAPTDAGTDNRLLTLLVSDAASSTDIAHDER